MCGGVALLVGVAVFLSSGAGTSHVALNVSPASQTAAYCLSDFGPCPANYCTFAANPPTITAGQSSAILFVCSYGAGYMYIKGSDGSSWGPDLDPSGVVGPTWSPQSSVTYTLYACQNNSGFSTAAGTGAYGTANCEDTLPVSPANPITLTVGSPCPTPAWQPWSNIFVIDPGQTANVNAAGYNICVTNYSGNYVVVPGGSGAELQSFINYAGNVGASTFSP